MLTPLNDGVILTSIPNEERKIGMIILPDTLKSEKQRPRVGEVVSYGDKVESLKAGDKVIHRMETGTDFEHEGENYWIINYPDILTIERADGDNVYVPLGDRVLIEVDTEFNADKKVGSIFLATTIESKEQSGKGRIIAIGDGNEEFNMKDLSVGDDVLFSVYGGVEFSVDGKDFMIFEYLDLLARIK
jgi:chaperonin GroES